MYNFKSNMRIITYVYVQNTFTLNKFQNSLWLRNTNVANFTRNLEFLSPLNLLYEDFENFSFVLTQQKLTGKLLRKSTMLMK